VVAATKVVKDDIAATKRASATNKKTAAEAKVLVEQAKKKAANLEVAYAKVKQSLAELLKTAPPELLPPLREIDDYVTQIQTDGHELTDDLVATWNKQSLLEKGQDTLDQGISKTEADEQKLEGKQKDYYGEAVKLAKIATDKDSDLAWYRRHWWGSWIALGAGVIACVVAAILKWGVKWGAKLTAAAGKFGV
jgi:chromosome segregation ATPase